MKRKYILKKESEVTSVFKSKKRRGNFCFIIHYVLQKTTSHFKFALSVGKKYGKAYQRNLIKRRFRSIITNYSLHLNPEMFFVIVIKPQAKGLNFQQLKNLFAQFALKINLLLPNH
ncbi:ribonuclease P protein component [Candidatus Phytoplasma meliae]|uniref:Ribonuclease P protein component n=1 Tax=Candidatus Phytoplasma meliae TaxID=1848402 RepID=A0ABS5CXJ4_9MOLU|nr:ribonuclease P protein component [Candidatus Phytoplasma meliae]MBP5835697.1 ribonuclease P protein component [Candidatus Phytoplasma meliae]